MKKVKSMCDFVYGGCEAVKEPERFLEFWFKTKKKPCLVCSADKSKCPFYHELVNHEGIDDNSK